MFLLLFYENLIINLTDLLLYIWNVLGQIEFFCPTMKSGLLLHFEVTGHLGDLNLIHEII